MDQTAILCIGDELLDGRVTDKNGCFLTQSAHERSLVIEEMRTVGDDIDSIGDALADLCRYDIVVVSGGLGPTDDDVTRQAAADFADVELQENKDSLERIQKRFAARGYPFTENNRRQCQFPDGADILASEVGTADAFCLHADGTQLYFFPGVPHEFRWFCKQCLPTKQHREPTHFRKKLVFFGRGESNLASQLQAVATQAKKRSVSIGYRAEFPLIEVMLKGAADDGLEIERQVHEEIGRWLVAEDDESFAARIGRRLREAGATVSVAESCTAGLLGAKLTEVSGSSSYFKEGYLTYANGAKERLVAVDAETLAAHGAVSPQVVAQMAAGARTKSGADFALAISGIAGPTGGTREKPVGTVDFALATADGVYLRRSDFPNRTRGQVRTLSVHVALALLLWRLEERLDEHNIRGPFDYDAVSQGQIADNI